MISDEIQRVDEGGWSIVSAEYALYYSISGCNYSNYLHSDMCLLLSFSNISILV